MPEEFKAGCQRPVSKKKAVAEVVETPLTVAQDGGQKMIKVGSPAPDFTAPAFFVDKFVDVSLEEYRGQWVVLCFYPGDFTFV